MKQLNKVLLTGLLALMAGGVIASGNLKVNILERNVGEAVVEVSNIIESQFEMEVRNENDNIIYYKKIQEPSKRLVNTYDFSKLSDGEYTFTVMLKKEMNRTTLAVKNGDVKVVHQTHELDPYFALNKDRLDISYLNHEKGEVWLFLYDYQSGEVIHRDKLGPDFAVNHALDLTQLKNGSYSAELVSNGISHEYDLFLD